MHTSASPCRGPQNYHFTCGPRGHEADFDIKRACLGEGMRGKLSPPGICLAQGKGGGATKKKEKKKQLTASFCTHVFSRSIAGECLWICGLLQADVPGVFPGISVTSRGLALQPEPRRLPADALSVCDSRFPCRGALLSPSSTAALLPLIPDR